MPRKQINLKYIKGFAREKNIMGRFYPIYSVRRIKARSEFPTLRAAKWGKRGTLPGLGKMKRIRILFIPRGRPCRELNSRRERNPIRSPAVGLSAKPLSHILILISELQYDRFPFSVFTFKLSSFSFDIDVARDFFFFFRINFHPRSRVNSGVMTCVTPACICIFAYTHICIKKYLQKKIKICVAPQICRELHEVRSLFIKEKAVFFFFFFLVIKHRPHPLSRLIRTGKCCVQFARTTHLLRMRKHAWNFATTRQVIGAEWETNR